MEYKAIFNTDENVWYVVQTFSPDHFLRHGPYKNEKSAKGRIRDLKAKEARERDESEAEAELNSDMILPPVEKIAYRTHNPPTITKINGLEIIESVPYRQRGVYPHVSKHAYRR